MKAAVGDRVVIRGHRVGDHERKALVLDVKGADGDPPFVVKWFDDEHVVLLWPGPDAVVERGAQSAHERT